MGGVQKELDDRIDRLREQGEWNTFTVAFYGETNAGKSTLIETLRILLGEQQKRQNFARLLVKFHHLITNNPLLQLAVSYSDLPKG